MGQKLDRVMYEISAVYIALPVFIFLAGWLRIIVAVPVCIIFIISLFLLMKNRPEPVLWHLARSQWLVVVVSLILLAIWVLLSGQGGFSFQNADYQYRNAIFHDLINKAWPVIYCNSTLKTGASIASNSIPVILTYYIGFWLPGALVGKIFGWYAANVFLYFWTYLGVVLVTYFLFRTLRNASIWSVLILIFFSGLDVLGYILTYSKLPGPIDHIEWWSGLQYSSNTTLLFWVFNQTVAMWLAILLIMNLKNSRSLFFLYAMLLLQGPFPFLGMLPVVLWKAYQGYPLELHKKGERHNIAVLFFRWFWSGVRRALTFENICGGISVLSIVFLYLTNNISASKSGTNKLTFNYYLFIVFECGLYLIILYLDHGKKPLFWICVGSLILIPFSRIGLSQDFCMRVSIPALFIMHIMIQQSLLGKEESQNNIANHVHPEAKKPAKIKTGDRRLVYIVLIVFLIIGAVVPLQEISRSIFYTLPPNNYTWSDSVKTLENDLTAAENFLGRTQNNRFYEYLARR